MVRWQVSASCREYIPSGAPSRRATPRGVCYDTASMEKITVELTLEELQTLVTMADNQLFRIRYLDSKIPGNISNPQDLRTAQAAVRILQDALKKEKGFRPDDGFALKGAPLSSRSR